VVSKLGPYSAARINPISSIAAMVSLVRSGYGVATLPYAAIWREVARGELIVLDVEPQLAPVPVVVVVRNPSESPIAQTVVSLAADAARAFASGPLAPFVTVPA
jgi:DNA-binding transcriptional LysR family regulator